MSTNMVLVAIIQDVMMIRVKIQVQYLIVYVFPYFLSMSWDTDLL